MPNLQGRILKNQYFLRSLEAKGSITDLYLAWDSRRAIKAAIKIFREDLSNNKQAYGAFQKEASLLQDIRHPNVVRMYDFDKENDITFLVMEWVDGINLKQHIENLARPLTLLEVSQILNPICNALYYIHHKNIFHCDIKPSNILMNSNGGDFLLSDFGVARGATDLISIGGTPAYMAPEHFMKQNIGSWTDIYSTGILLYEMLSGGVLPFHGDDNSPGSTTRERIFWEHLNSPPPPISKYNPDITNNVVQVIETALKKDPSHRFKSILEFFDAFEKATKENSIKLSNLNPDHKENIMKELFCPEHGPYDASLGACPYPHDPELPLMTGVRKNSSDKDDFITDVTDQYDTTSNGGYCPEHGPYSGSSCPYPHKEKYKARVFISSTFEDLKEYREVVFKAIHSLFGYSDDMLFWSADERDATTISLERVKQCDVVVLLVAHRYGYVPSGEKFSITEMEYRTARASDIPVLAFFVDEKIPWLISYVETEKKEELQRFKKLVESEVIRKTFKSKDELFALVTQAFHHFLERHRHELEGRKKFKGTLLTKSHIELDKESDILVCIGQSDDDLPLILGVKRSKELQSRLNDLAEIVSPYSDDNSVNEILSDFRLELEKYAAKTWASNQIFKIRMKNGGIEKMYVTNKNLSELTSSLFSRIIKSTKKTIIIEGETPPTPANQPRTRFAMSDDDEEPTDLGFDNDEAATDDSGQVISFGGINRFLGISISNGKVYSIGRDLTNQWVEWHPFEFETIGKNFPHCKFQIGRTEDVSLSSYHSKLKEYCLENVDQEGNLYSNTTLVLSRQSIGLVIVKIANAVSNLHSYGKIHGDLKPSNILLTVNGPELIDGFNLLPGERAPGWTPNWSAPEQIMREPISFVSDIYSLGVITANFLSGYLVGEVRKFQIPNVRNRIKEHDVFYNPSVFIQDIDSIIPHGANQWMAFIKSCLKFEGNSRPKSVEHFASQLDDLLRKYPVQGDIYLDLSGSGQIVAATLVDGTKRVSRLLSDDLS